MVDENHADLLKKSYRKVACQADAIRDFSDADLASSRSLFDSEQLRRGKAQPIVVDVYAVLSGINFNKKFLELIDDLYAELTGVLAGTRYYLVEPRNLGVEYAVLKWPEGRKDEALITEAINTLRGCYVEPFLLKVFGIQLHRDGCIILKCVDEPASIFKVRDLLRATLPDLPDKQSNWAHIPLGRILEPIGVSRMSKLKSVLTKIDKSLEHDIPIHEIHVVHEKTWYMESKEYLYTKRF